MNDHSAHPHADLTFSDANIVKIDVDGVLVEGIITYRDVGDIGVRITKPFFGMGRGIHIPGVARAVHTYDGVYGDSTARHLLRSLYDLGLMLEQVDLVPVTVNLQVLKAAIGKLTSTGMTADRYIEAKMLLRSRFKKGEIGQKEYQSNLKQIGNDNFKLVYAVEELQNEFFKHNLPQFIPGDVRRKLIAVIDGRESLYFEDQKT